MFLSCTHRTHNIDYNISFQKSTKFLNEKKEAEPIGRQNDFLFNREYTNVLKVYKNVLKLKLQPK